MQQAKTSILVEAIRNKIISHFTLKASQAIPAGQFKNRFKIIAGHIRFVKGEYIYVDLVLEESLMKLFKEHCLKNKSKELFNIMFHPNRTTFLYQHNAVEWMKRHHLFECLINDQLYHKALKNRHYTGIRELQ